MFGLGLPPPPSAAEPAAQPQAALKPLASGYRDQQCHCRDCGRKFIFTAEQQESLAAKGFKGALKSRCDACAKFKKNRRHGARAEPARGGSLKVGAGFKYVLKGKAAEEAEEGDPEQPAPIARRKRDRDDEPDEDFDNFDVYDCGGSDGDEERRPAKRSAKGAGRGGGKGGGKGRGRR